MSRAAFLALPAVAEPIALAILAALLRLP